MTTHCVVIRQAGEEARLHCDTFAEAHDVRRSFENYGRCESVTIEPCVDRAEMAQLALGSLADPTGGSHRV